MASASLEEVRQAIIEDGFWTLQDAAIGKHLDEIVSDGFRIQTVKGMNLCKVAALDHTVSKSKLPQLPYLTDWSLFEKFLNPSSIDPHLGFTESLGEQREPTASSLLPS